MRKQGLSFAREMEMEIFYDVENILKSANLCILLLCTFIIRIMKKLMVDFLYDYSCIGESRDCKKWKSRALRG
jgi:hypothetical protein